MAISDCKVMNVPLDAQASQFHLNGEGLGNRSQPDVPTVSADELKDIMDALSTKVLAPAHNKLLDELQILDTSNLVPHLKNLNDPDHPYHVATVIDANTQNGDIPTIGLLVNSFGGGDMSTIDYVTGDPDNVNAVDHALLADDADALGGHAGSYFATAQDLSDLSQTVTALGNSTNTLTNEINKIKDGTTDPPQKAGNYTLSNVCLPGVLLQSRKRIRFSIPLWTNLAAYDHPGLVTLSSSSMSVHGFGGQLATGTLSQIMDNGSITLSVSGSMVNVIIDRSTDLSDGTNQTPLTIFGTFTVRLIQAVS